MYLVPSLDYAITARTIGYGIGAIKIPFLGKSVLVTYFLILTRSILKKIFWDIISLLIKL